MNTGRALNSVHIVQYGLESLACRGLDGLAVDGDGKVLSHGVVHAQIVNRAYELRFGRSPCDSDVGTTCYERGSGCCNGRTTDMGMIQDGGPVATLEPVDVVMICAAFAPIWKVSPVPVTLNALLYVPAVVAAVTLIESPAASLATSPLPELKSVTVEPWSLSTAHLSQQPLRPLRR